MPMSAAEQRLLRGSLKEREAEAKRQGVFETWETKARRDNNPKEEDCYVKRVARAQTGKPDNVR